MKIGINATGQTPRGSVSAYIDHAVAAEAEGFASESIYIGGFSRC